MLALIEICQTPSALQFTGKGCVAKDTVPSPMSQQGAGEHKNSTMAGRWRNGIW